MINTLSSGDNAESTIRALRDQAARLGFMPDYRTGSAFSAATVDGRVMVLMDGDEQPVPAFNYAGPLATGQRLITVRIAPHGLYVFGAISTAFVPLVEQFTVTGTSRFTKTAGMLYAIVEVQAAGGAGGGAGATGVSQWSFGDGGGGGEYARGILLASQISDAGEIVTVGQGGIAGTGNGAAGTSSSFGSLITCVAGGGGSVRTATGTLNYSANTQTRNGGGGGTGGTTRIAGSPGGMGIGITSTPQGVRAGDGGQSFLAGGRVESLSLPGTVGRPYGGGGSGAANSASLPAVAGGAGADGIVIVTSYFS